MVEYNGKEIAVMDGGSKESQNTTNFNVRCVFDRKDGILDLMRKKLSNCSILSHSITKNRQGKYEFNALVKADGAGIPDLGDSGLNSVKRWEAPSFFDGVHLFSVRMVGGLDEYTFMKWIQNTLCYCKMTPQFGMTGDMWDRVWLDFRKQEEVIKRRNGKS